jgi:phospholipase D1/2
MGIYEVRSSGLIVDGRDYYKAFYHAAKKARQYILLAGWQFDSDILLLRGRDAEEAGGEMRLLSFLNSLCEGNPDLHIYVLAWDFSILFALDREWFQEWLFNWTTNDRLHFKFDDKHAIGASHHQKLVVIDGQFAFVGGLDICSNHWDSRQHKAYDPLRRNPDGQMYEPYHDVQSYHAGPAAIELAGLFQARWENLGGGKIDLPVVPEEIEFLPESGISVQAERVGVSRTQAKTIVPLQESIREIRSLYLDAIWAAENMIYIENQYFSSQAVHKALLERMLSEQRPKLQIVMVLPRRPHTLIEEIAVGAAQTKMLYVLRETAARTGHDLGIYFTVSDAESIPTYIHSKLLIVDDRFLTVGSANATNRSMGLDTELNVAWEETDATDSKLSDSIGAIRVDLLCEHTGVIDCQSADIHGLVKYLDHLAAEKKGRLRHHTMETIFGDAEDLKELRLDKISLDPEEPIIEENVFELIQKDSTGLFSKGIDLLNKWLTSFTKNEPYS